jgi:di/tricarboxylate transporter
LIPETYQITLVLTILVGSVILFAWERFGPDIVAMLVLITLAVTGLVSPDEVFSGFASPAVVTVWAVYILSDGLFKTGVADFLGAHILKIAGSGEARLIAVIMLMVGLMSAFMNNIGATAVLLPAIIGVSKQTGISPSKFLIPLSFASLMGGNMTLIGTPPNILAAGILQETTALSFSFFDFTPMGIIVLGTGVAYMVLFGRHLLPTAKTEDDLTHSYNLRNYATEIRILPNSPLVGKTIVESRFGEDFDLTLVSKLSTPQATQLPAHLSRKRRLSGRQLPARRNAVIQAGDLFLVHGNLENIFRIKDAQGFEIEGDVELQDADLQSEDVAFAEGVVTPSSELVGRTLKQSHFREQYYLNVLAIWRDEHPIRQKLADTPLQFGDVLLLQGRKERLTLTQNNPGLLMLEPVPYQARRTSKTSLALAIMAVMLLVVTMGWLHISIAAVIAAMAMVLTQVLSMDEAYRAIQWRSIFLIAGMLPLGIAMETSGAAQFLANQIVNLTGRWGPIGVLVGIYILTVLITQPMSNAAATVLVAPIAISVATNLSVDPRPFVMGVVIAASTAFLTPIGHQANVLIYGVGSYKFSDFTKVGIGLNLLYLLIVAIVLPLIWSF